MIQLTICQTPEPALRLDASARLDEGRLADPVTTTTTLDGGVVLNFYIGGGGCGGESPVAARLGALQAQLNVMELRIMSAIDDLTAAEKAEGEAISANLATQHTAIQEIAALLQNISDHLGGDIDPAVLQQLTQDALARSAQITAANTALQESIAAAQAATHPATPPAAPAAGEQPTATSSATGNLTDAGASPAPAPEGEQNPPAA